jgi:hypothetical protein
VREEGKEEVCRTVQYSSTISPVDANDSFVSESNFGCLLLFDFLYSWKTDDRLISAFGQFRVHEINSTEVIRVWLSHSQDKRPLTRTALRDPSTKL